jgi:hypothetical protein
MNDIYLNYEKLALEQKYENQFHVCPPLYLFLLISILQVVQVHILNYLIIKNYTLAKKILIMTDKSVQLEHR